MNEILYTSNKNNNTNSYQKMVVLDIMFINCINSVFCFPILEVFYKDEWIKEICI